MRGARLVWQHHWLVYRRTWKGSIFISFLSPVLYLLAMGIGLGSLISRGPVHTVAGVSYLNFVAPGVLAATAMQNAFSDTAYPIMSRAYWMGTYSGMLATPLRVGDLVSGEVAWLTFRLFTVTGIFFIAMAAFETVRSPIAVLAVPVAILTGLAFGAPIMAYTVTQRRDAVLSVIGRFIITPLFILSGTFFPISQLPALVQGIAWLTPLPHGVALSRDLALGTPSMPAALLHTAVLAAYVTTGVAVARTTFHRQLVT